MLVVKQSICGTIAATKTSSFDASTKRGVIFYNLAHLVRGFLKVEREEEILENKG